METVIRFIGSRIFNDIAGPIFFTRIQEQNRTESKVDEHFLLLRHRVASNRHFPRLDDRKIKSVTEETLLSRQTLCSRSLPLRPFVRTTIRSSATLFSFYDLTSSSPADSTRLDFTRSIPTLAPLALLQGEYTLANKKTLNCCAAYYEKSLRPNSRIREKLLRDSSHHNRRAPRLFVVSYNFARILWCF